MIVQKHGRETIVSNEQKPWFETNVWQSSRARRAHRVSTKSMLINKIASLLVCNNCVPPPLLQNPRFRSPPINRQSRVTRLFSNPLIAAFPLRVVSMLPSKIRGQILTPQPIPLDIPLNPRSIPSYLKIQSLKIQILMLLMFQHFI